MPPFKHRHLLVFRRLTSLSDRLTFIVEARTFVVASDARKKMTELLQKAISEVSKLAPAQQDALASLLLDELASEHQWDLAFAASATQLEELAEEALEEHRKGFTKELDLDSL